MVFAFISEYDHSARNVLDWLNYICPALNVKVFTDHSKLHPLVFEISNALDSEILGHLNSQEITFYYYRRGKFKSFTNENMEVFDNGSKEWLKREEESIFEYFENNLKLNASYGSIVLETRTNKLINLRIAKQSGFNIPHTLITTSKNKLLDFYKLNKRGIIVKPITDHRPLITNRGILYNPQGTKKVTLRSINQLHDEFFPCAFQEYIEKIYEIRVFFMLNTYMQWLYFLKIMIKQK